MEIKGTAVKSTKEFIKSRFLDRYQQWENALPEKSRVYYTSAILSGNWYPLRDAILIPTRIAGDLFFEGDYAKAGFELGRESALEALQGIYKIFVKIASVDFVLKRVKTIFSTYYSSGKFEIVSREEKRIEFLVSGFDKEDDLIFDRISGWIEGIFSVISHEAFTVKHNVIEKGDKIASQIIALWE